MSFEGQCLNLVVIRNSRSLLSLAEEACARVRGGITERVCRGHLLPTLLLLKKSWQLTQTALTQDANISGVFSRPETAMHQLILHL